MSFSSKQQHQGTKGLMNISLYRRQDAQLLPPNKLCPRTENTRVNKNMHKN